MTVVGDKQIVWLDIAMNDALLVRRGQAVGNGDGDFNSFSPIHRLSRKPLAYRLTLQEFHHGKVDVAVKVEIVQCQNVGVGERGDRPGLALEPAQSGGIRGKMGGQNLDCYLAVEARVFGAVDLPHSSRANRPQDAVPADLLPD